MNKKGMSKKRQRRLTLVGITSVVTIWMAALALLFSQPGVQSNGNLLPTLASGLQGVAVLPDTGAAKPMSPTLLPTSLPVELPPGSQVDTALISNPANPIAEISPTQPALINIPDEPVPNSLVIRFKPEMSQAERLDYITALGGQIVQEIKPLDTVIISLPANAAAGIQSVEPGVLENEPDYYAGALYSPNDSLAAGQWGLDVVKAPQAWDLLPASTPGITVAVIDSGICASHIDLQGRITSNGWDFIDNDSTPQDEYGHGCAVSGIIAANSNNNVGIAGVAPNTNVMALRVLDADGIGRYSNVAAAIVYAVDNGAGAINLSLGGPNPSAVLQDAVNYAEAHGVTVIAAAGNSGLEQVYYPAAYPAVVAVGSVSQNLQRSPFSNYGAGIDLYAPGDGITTTSLDGSFQNYSGTSVAAPYVTGVWALRQAMGKALVQDGGIVSALYANDAPVPTEEPASELCLLSDKQAAESAYFGLVQQNAAQPGSVSTEQLEAARAAYLGLAEQCANALYDDNMTIDGGGISPFGGEIAPLFQIFGTKWQQESPTSPQIGAAFNQGQPPAEPGGIITYSFMPSNVSLANKEAENGGGSNAFITAISDLPNNAQCDLQGRIQQAFTAWEAVANVDFQEVTETGLVPFGETGAVGDMRIGAQFIDGMKGELGHAYFPPPDPEIVTSTRSGDIFLDRSEVWGCEPSAEGVTPRVLDIGLVMLHELGHALGMQHERAAGVLALMNPTYNTTLLTDAAGGNLSLTTALRSDDQSGARAIYGGIGVSAPSLQEVLETSTDNTPTFTWIDTVTGGADYFEIEIYLDDNGQPGEVIFDGTTSGGNTTSNKSFTIPNTLQSLPYLWRVRAFDEGAYGVWSDYDDFAITVGIPAPLSPTAGQVLNSGDVRFLWGTAGGATTYLLQIATQAEFTPESLIVDQTVDGTAFTAPTLTDGTYYWRVQTGNNPFSIIYSFKVDSAALVVDLSPGAANASPADGAAFTGAGANENITVQWDALDGVSEYQLQLDTSENFVGLLFLDKLFLDKLFLDKLFLDKLFLDKLFLDKLFLDKLFLDKLFLDKLFLDKLFLDKLFLDKLFLDKLFLDKLFLDKIEYSGGDTASFTFDSLPLSEGVHYWRVRPRLPDGSFGPWSESRSFTVRTQDTKVVINEIKLSDPSWIEFHNTGTQTANMGGWQFFAYGPSGETQLLYTFPAGFTMQPGGYSVLYEGTGTDTDRTLYSGGNQINWPLTAQGDEPVTGEALNGFGSVVPGLNITAETQVTGVESASLASQPTPVISSEPNGELVAPSMPLALTNNSQPDATSTDEPNATAQSTPPASVQADDDLVTAQAAFNIAIGDTVSDGVPGAGAGNIESAGTNDTYTFAATAGQIVYLDYLSTSNTSLDWALRSPSNVLVFSSGITSDGGRRVLTETGNYVITVNDNSNVATGTYSFKLWGVTDSNFAIAIGDTVSNGVPSAGAGNIEQPGVQDIYTFTGTAGDVLYFDNLDYSNSSLLWRLNSPTAVQLFNTGIYNDDANRTLTETGTYTITVYDTDAAVGTYSFKIWNVPAPQNFAIAIGDTVSNGVPSVGAGNIEQPGAQDIYTFTGTAGDVLYFDNLDYSNSSLLWRLNSPTAVQLFNTGIYNDDANRTLTETGTYTITVYDTDAAVGTYSFKIWTVPAPQNFAIAIGDTVSNGVPSAGAGNIEQPGVQDIYTFTGTAGDVLYFDNLDYSNSSLLWRLNSPTNVQLFNTGIYGDASNHTLTETGTYTITVYDTDAAVGTYSFKIWNVPAPQNFAIAIGDIVSNGVPAAGAGNIEQPGVQDIYTFTGTAGDVLYFDNLDYSNGSLLWRLNSPTAVQLFNTGIYNDDSRRTLTETGTYTITVYDTDAAVGTYSFKIWTVPAADSFAITVGDVISNGVPGTGAGNIEQPGVQDIYTFTGTAGDVLYFDNLDYSNGGLNWRLNSPTAVQLFNTGIYNDDANRTLTETGTYTITVYDTDAATGTYSIRVSTASSTEIGIAVDTTVSNNNPANGAGNINPAGNIDVYVFGAAAGQIITFDVLSGAAANMHWRLETPGGAEIFNTSFTDQTNIAMATTGTYTLTVQASASNPTFTGNYSFRLVNVPTVQNFAIAIGDTVSNGVPSAGAGNIELAGGEDQYTFSATAGDIVYLDSVNNIDSGIRWQLLNPASSSIFDTLIASNGGRRVLSQTGTYTVRVYGNNNSSGTYSFKIWSVVDSNFAINMGDTVSNGVPSAGAGNIETPGVQDAYTFTATAGDIVYFDGISSAGSILWNAYTPSNAGIFQAGVDNDYGRVVLNETGTYTINVFSNTDSVGSYSFKVWAVPQPENFAINMGDTVANGVPGAGAGNLEAVGARDIYTFNATAGDIVYFEGISSAGSILWNAYTPSNAGIFQASVDNDYGRVVLTETGTYTITVFSSGLNTGIYSFKVWAVPQPQNFAINMGDTVIENSPGAGAGNLEAVGARDIYTFNATAGDIVYFDGISSTGGILWNAYTPSNAGIFQNSVDSDYGRVVLTETGTYTITVFSSGLNTGIYSFKVWAVPQPQNFAINIGNTVSNGIPSVGAGNIEAVGARDIYTFNGTSGQQVSFDGISSAGGILWNAYTPSNVGMFQTGVDNDGGAFTLSETGTYTITVFSSGLNTGIYSFKLVAVSEVQQTGPTFTVNNTSDVDDGMCGVLDCSLREAINAANVQAGANTINFNLTPGANIMSALLPTISTAITIDGANASNVIINGNNTGRILSVNSTGVLSLLNVTVANGLATDLDGGGGLYNAGGTVTVTNAIFDNNATGITQYGGAIFNQAGTLTVNTSTFSNNSADYGGGAIFNWKGSATITNSVFGGGNTAAVGGALHNYSPDAVTATMTITGGEIGDNPTGTELGTGGGAIMSEGSIGAAQLTVNGTHIHDNSGYQGGGIWVHSGTATLTNLNLHDNDVNSSGGGLYVSPSSTVTITGSTISDNIASSEGGGLYSSGTVTISNSTLSGNQANIGGAVVNGGTMTVDTTSFTSNETTANQGGAIANFNTITIDRSTFEFNIAGSNGGALDNSAFGTATATATITNSTLITNTAGSVGGALLNYADITSATAILTVRNSTISGNVSTAGYGGGIANFGGLGNETINIEFSTFVSNEAVDSANLRNMPDKTVNVKNSITALPVSGANCGGLISNAGGNFMDDSSCNGFTQVTSVALNLGALANNGGSTQTIALGAGSVAIDGAANCLDFNEMTVTTDQRGTARPQGVQCDAGAYEAAPLAGSLTVTTTQMIQDGLDGKCSLPEAIIAANTGAPSGAVSGECVPGVGADTITLGTNEIYTLTQVDNNTPLGLSGASNGLPIVSSTINLVMNGSTITRASDAVEDFRIIAVSDAGNLTINGGGGTISGGRLSEVGANGLGSAVYNEGTTSINNATIENNQSGSGAVASYGTLSITGSILRDNQAVGYGGAIYSLGPLTLTTTVFENNQAEIDGGALFNSGSSTIARSSFIDNHAVGSAGAIINAGSMSIENATFSGNSSDSVSTILNLGSNLSILHSTIADNITTDNDFGAVQNDGGTLSLTNSIIANNSGSDNCVGTITDGGGNIQYPDESCVVYFDTANPLLGELTLAGNAYFYPLLTGSPALDHGAEFYCTAFDIRGVARPAGDCDSGSYEGSIALTGDLTVTTTQPISNPSDGLCSLVEAIDAANSGQNSGNAPGECVPNSSGADTITLGTGLTYELSVINNIVNDATGLPIITSPITINANGSTITRSSEANFRIFYVDADGSLTLNNVTLSNGIGNPGGAILVDGVLTLNSSSISNNTASSGGGIFINGTATINQSAIVNNTTIGADDGGGLFVVGTLTLTNSTVASNTAASTGGGIVTSAIAPLAEVIIINSTIANNSAGVSGGGIQVWGGSATVSNTILANNTFDFGLDGIGAEAANCVGTVNDGGSNIQWPEFTCTDTIPEIDPLLGPLTGSPAYLPLGTDSPAIDAGNASICTSSPVNSVDQRGIPRPVGAGCDIGAVEISEAPALVPGTTGGAAALVSPLTTDFVRFGDTTIGPANASEWTGDNVAVTDSNDNNVTIGRDPSSSDTNHVTDWATQRPTEGGQNFTNVLINEIYTGSNDYVELYNPRAETADISNWELKLYDGNDQLIAAGQGATYTVRFAAGTLLRPGQFLVVGEQNPGGNIDFIPVASIDWDDANASGAVTLTNGLTPIDFVRFGSSQANQLLVEPPTGTPFTGVVQSPLPGESIGRSSISEDINNSSDWYSQVRSTGAVNPAIAPPANDNFTGATTIDALPFRDTGDTTNASAIGDPALSCGASVGHTIWYKYTPTATQTIRLQTDGSDFDTVLAVFTLVNPNTPQQIAGLCSQRADENNPQPGSRLSFQAIQGTTYYILIGGQLNVSGQYIFSVNAPVNDDVANASLVGSLPFRTFNTDTGVSNTNTTAATILDDEPAPTCAPSAGRTVWYRYEAADATPLRLRTVGTLFDTVITVYTGTPENLVEVTCNNDDASETTSDLGFTPVPGTTYYFQVAGNSDQGGDLLFEVDVFPAPDNDLIGAAYTVTPDGDGTFSVTTLAGTTPAPFDQDTTGATNTDDPVVDQCALNAGATVWYSYTADTLDTVVFQTFGSKYDTVLSIWTGDLLTPASLTQLGCNDDVSVNKDSRLTLGDIADGVVADVQVTVGTTYYIGVSGYFGETGDLVFNAFTPQITPPENDRVTAPYDISFNIEDGTYSVLGTPANENTPFMQDTTGAFPELVIVGPAPDGEDDITVPTPTCGDDVGYTVWYRYAAPERQQIVFDAAGSDFDTVITAYVLQGNQLVEVGCNDDFEGRAQSKLTLNTDAGVTLYLLFGGFKKDRGNLDLVISQSIAVTSFTLVNAADGSANVDPLVDGAVILAAELPDAISIRANTDPEEIGSVKFELSGDAVLTTTDNEAPYAINGNNAPPDNSYIPWAYAPGTYTLKATPYAGNNGLGRPGTPLTITFTISDNQPPLIAADEDPITVDEGLSAFNTGTFSDPDADPVTLSATVGTVTDLGDGTWEWSYLTSDGPAESQTITITADDGQPNGQETVSFELIVNNVAPTASLNNSMLTATTARLTFSNQQDASSVDQAAGFKYSYDCTNDGTFEPLATGIDADTFDCVYTVSGPYTARGRIADKDGGFTDITVDLVIVIGNQPPVADAGDDQTVTATRPTLKKTVTLDGSGSSDSDGTIQSYIWTEGDQQIASGITPSVDLAIGTHTITLTVTDDEDSQATDTVTIIVEAPANSAPVADAGADQLVTDVNKNGSELVTLDGSASTDADGDNTILSYIWKEGDTEIATGETAQVNLPVGSHTITLTVTDDLGLQDSDDVVIEIVAPAVVAPTANAGPDQVVSDTDRNGSELVTLNGAGSSDDGTITSYVWTENGTEIATGVNPTITLAVGTHTIVLTVTDDDLATGTDTVVVKVNAPPTANASLDQTVSVGTNNVTLNGSGSSDSDGTIVSYAWTEGATTLSTQVAPTLTLPLGLHTLTLTVTDNNGATGTDTVVITVIAANVPPTANAGNDQTVTDSDNNGSEIVTLNGSGSSDGDGTITGYVWTENGGQIATGATPQVTLNVGSHTLTLTVTDDDLATGTDTVVITVLPQSTGPITVDDQIELSSDDVNEDGNSYDARNPQLWFGSGQSVTKSFMGLRFNNLEIPQGAVITEAHIEVYTATAQWIRMRILIGGEAVDDSTTFSSATRPSTRAFTSARLDYQSNTPWPAATWNNIGDVKAVVQEIVNRPGWLPGNSLSILIKGLGSQWGRKFVTSYDGNPAFAPRLVVSYAGGPPPSNNPPDVNVNAPSVTVNEGVLASISGTVTDPDNNPVTLIASLGTVVKSGNTWSWSYTPADGPLNQTVTINAADNRGGSDSVTFDLIVNNVVPTASFSATPLSTYPNSPVTVTFSSPVDVAADLIGLTYSIDCGNGVVQTGTTAACTYGAEGTFTVLGRITDKDGGYSDYQATIIISSTPTGPTTITPQVNGSSDDVNENGTKFQVNSSTVWVGTEGSVNQSYTGLRFNNLGIPAGATITEAYLEFYVSNSQWIGIDVLIAGDAADNSATFSNGSRPSGRPVTTNRIEHHSNVNWAANTWNALTGNLSGVVQEIVSRPGWQSGNSLSLILKGMGSGFGRKFVTSYDGNPAFAPRLVIKYTVPNAPAPLIVVPPPAPIILPTPPTAAFTSDMSSGVAPLTVQFSNLSTGDIAGYSWDFGDGTGSSDANPAHVYNGVGAFTVMLAVTGLDGTIVTAQAVITVAAPPPSIEVIPPPVEEATPAPTEEIAASPPPEATAAP